MKEQLLCLFLGHIKPPECDHVILLELHLRIHTHWCIRCGDILLKQISPVDVDRLMVDPGLVHEDQSAFMH